MKLVLPISRCCILQHFTRKFGILFLFKMYPCYLSFFPPPSLYNKFVRFFYFIKIRSLAERERDEHQAAYFLVSMIQMIRYKEFLTACIFIKKGNITKLYKCILRLTFHRFKSPLSRAISSRFNQKNHVVFSS